MTGDSPDADVSVSYDPATDTYRATFDSATVSPTVAVVEAMAAVRGTDTTDLRPLYDAVDPQGLDRVCSDSVPPYREGARTVEFTYLDHQVTVDSRGVVEIRSGENDD